MVRLPKGMPFASVLKKFLSRYAQCATYWYVPKTRALNDDNVNVIREIVKIVHKDFQGAIWNPTTQDRILTRLVRSGILSPTTARRATDPDRRALIRIWKKWLETLGLLWIQDDKEIIITDAGLALIHSSNPRSIIEGQIAKLQYPTPSLTGDYAEEFEGVLPHLFLLQVLQQNDYRISFEEYELFVNLARSQDDLAAITQFIQTWRDLNDEERQQVRNLAARVPMRGDPEFKRFHRIGLNASYQRAMFAYPSYLMAEHTTEYIECTARERVDQVLKQRVGNLKVTIFKSPEEWFAYFGDPGQQPSWYTYLSHEVARAPTKARAQAIVVRHKQHLTEDQLQEIKRLEIEKGIEDFYVTRLGILEKGLRLVSDGRQYAIPIGRIDLLCKGADGKYVVVEVKADEANDSVFGQILRYIGWVHRNLPNGNDNVRGIILAGQFPETARYSRIGLLRTDHEKFLRFKRHGLHATDT